MLEMMTMTAEQQGLLSSLPSDLSPEGPSWLVGLKRHAADVLRRQGFPTRKHEAWRFTPLDPIVSVPFVKSAPAAVPAWVAEHLGHDDSFRVVVVNGRPRFDLLAPPPGVEVRRLVEALGRSPELIEPYLGRLARPEHFAALNAAMFDDGVLITVEPLVDVERPIHLLHVARAAVHPTACFPRVLVLVGEGSRLVLNESWLAEPGRHLAAPVTEIVLAPGAKVEHTRITEGAAESFHLGSLAVSQGRESGYASRVVTIGGALSRLDLEVVLDGEGADCLLDGVYHVTGREHVDCYTRIDHARPWCTSNERYRGVVDGKGHAVFDGTIIVRKQSQRTDAHQENRNLLLSDDATVHTKPHLRIDADDVKCSHGATIGALDEDSLFYLRARGIPERLARTILTYAFVRELVDPIPQPALRKRAGELLLSRLSDGQAIREIL